MKDPILPDHQGFCLESHIKSNTCNSSLTFLSSQSFPPQSRKYPISPVICGHIKPPKHLWGSDCFGVHPHFSVRFSTIYVKKMHISNTSDVGWTMTKQHCTNLWCAVSKCSKYERCKITLKTSLLLYLALWHFID